MGLDNDVAAACSCFDAGRTKLVQQTLVGWRIGLSVSIDLNVRNAKDTSARPIRELFFKGLRGLRLQLNADAGCGTRGNLVEIERACRCTLASIGFPIFFLLIVPTANETDLLGNWVFIGSRIECAQSPLRARASCVLIGALEFTTACTNCCMDLEIHILCNICSLIELCQCRAKLFAERSVCPEGVVKDGLRGDCGADGRCEKYNPQHGVKMPK